MPSRDPTVKIRSFNVNDRVTARISQKWEFGTITKKLDSRRFYVVNLDSGRSLKKHIDQLRATDVPRKTVTFDFRPPLVFGVPTRSSQPQPVPDVQIKPTQGSPISANNDPHPILGTSSAIAPPKEIQQRPTRRVKAPTWFRDYDVSRKWKKNYRYYNYFYLCSIFLIIELNCIFFQFFSAGGELSCLCTV